MARSADLAASDFFVNAAVKAVFVAALVLIFVACGTISYGVPAGQILGVRNIGWMWIPFFVPFGFGILFTWLIFGKK